MPGGTILAEMLVPKGHNVYNPRRQPGETLSNAGLAPTGRYSQFCNAPLGLAREVVPYPRLTPGVIDIPSLRDGADLLITAPIVPYVVRIAARAG